MQLEDFITKIKSENHDYLERVNDLLKVLDNLTQSEEVIITYSVSSGN